MVNNNGIPIEVKKPFETVYEIKNEIPSFEEFMKTYENDANLNYDDLSGGSVGEVKGYGPCIINGQLNYDNCRCSSNELDRQLKIIRNKRELEALEREKRKEKYKAFQQREDGATIGVGNQSGVIPPGAVIGSAVATIAKLFG